MRHIIWRPASNRDPKRIAEMICGAEIGVEPRCGFGDRVQHGTNQAPCTGCFGPHSNEVARWEARAR